MNKKFLYMLVFICLRYMPPVFAEEKPTISEVKMGWYFPAINSMVSRTDFKTALDFWTQEFNKSINIKQSEVRLFDHISDMQAAFNKGELNVIVAPPLLIAKYFSLDSLADGFVGKSASGKPYGMVVLARADSGIKQIADLKAKRLVLPESDELASVFLETLVIPQFQQSYQQIFSSVETLQKQNAIVHSLFFNKADVGVVFLETYNLMVELNPQIRQKLKILATFPINSPNYSFFHAQYPENDRKLFIEKLLKLNDSVRTQQILNGFRMSALVKCPVDSLKPFIRLNERYQQLQSQINQVSE